MSDQLIWAVKNGDLDALKKNKIDVNIPVGNTVLLCAAADYGQCEVIDYLLSCGAEVNQEDKYGITPLLAAIFENHLEAAQLLLKKGASKSGKGPDGSSYIECAESNEMKLLLA